MKEGERRVDVAVVAEVLGVVTLHQDLDAPRAQGELRWSEDLAPLVRPVGEIGAEVDRCRVDLLSTRQAEEPPPVVVAQAKEGSRGGQYVALVRFWLPRPPPS